MVNIPEIVYIGMTQLNYTENEIRFMTPRKFYMMVDAHRAFNGIKPRTKYQTIDDTP